MLLVISTKKEASETYSLTSFAFETRSNCIMEQGKSSKISGMQYLPLYLDFSSFLEIFGDLGLQLQTELVERFVRRRRGNQRALST